MEWRIHQPIPAFETAILGAYRKRNDDSPAIHTRELYKNGRDTLSLSAHDVRIVSRYYSRRDERIFNVEQELKECLSSSNAYVSTEPS